MIASLLLILATLLVQAAAAPACGAEVTTPKQGTFVGKCLQEVEEYQGIPYAQAITSQHRFTKTKPVQRYTSSKKRNATMAGPVCRQPFFPYNDPGVTYSEDCLFLNVYRPRNVKGKLPVMVWIHGGAFLQGAGSGAQFNATRLIQRGLELNKPFVYVSLNYRLGAFGFLGGKAIASAVKNGNATLNAGYYDQREALHWVQRNIGSFGGDSSRVTLFGESAGANSVGQQMLANEGDVQGLFRAAILESGSPSLSRRLPPTDPYAQGRYEAFLAAAGCDISASDEAQIACLRSAPSDNLDAANTAAAANQQAPFIPLQDDFFVRGLPSAQFKRGAFPSIPFITGDNVDEGTLFSVPQNITSDAVFADVVLTTYGAPIKPLIPDILKLWPNDPTVGSPYMPFLFGDSPNDTFFGEGNQFKRLSSFGGDLLFESGRRQQLLAAVKTGKAKAWSYRFGQPLPLAQFSTGPNKADSLGVPHASEIDFVYNKPILAGEHIDELPEPQQSYATDDKLNQVASIMSSAWIHFAHDLDPNGANVPHWPEYGSDVDHRGAGINLFLQGGNVSLQRDSYQWKQTSFILNHHENFFI